MWYSIFMFVLFTHYAIRHLQTSFWRLWYCYLRAVTLRSISTRLFLGLTQLVPCVSFWMNLRGCCEMLNNVYCYIACRTLHRYFFIAVFLILWQHMLFNSWTAHWCNFDWDTAREQVCPSVERSGWCLCTVSLLRVQVQSVSAKVTWVRSVAK